MKKSLLVGALAAALVLPSVAAAQQGAERGVPFLHLRQELQLTPQQVTQLEAISARLEAQNRPLMEQMRAAGAHQREARAGAVRGGERMRQMRGQMQRMTPEQRAEMQGRMRQMTPEQRAEMHERMRRMTPEQRAEMHAERHGERPAGARGERGQQMREQMQGMTPEQRAEMQGRMRGERPARTAAAPRSALPEELRPVAAQVRQNRAAAMQEARGVLTPEQRERAQQLMRERGGQRAPRGQADRR